MSPRPSPRPTALIVSREPARHNATLVALDRRGMRLRFALDDVQVTEGLAEHPSLVLVDLTHRASISRRTVERINRLRGRALVVALHQGNLDEASRTFSELSVDGYCHAGAGAAAPLSAFARPADVGGSGLLH